MDIRTHILASIPRSLELYLIGQSMLAKQIEAGSVAQAKDPQRISNRAEWCTALSWEYLISSFHMTGG